jgi:CubicO group peptidase (beta-lactamase class C family)
MNAGALFFRLGFALVMATEISTIAAGFSFPRSAPEEQGVSSAKLLGYVEALDAKIEGMHSVMVVRHGKVIAEGWWTPYDAKSRHVMYSLSKSFAATAVGLAQAEGKLSVDDSVVSFFPDLAPEKVSDNLKNMRVRDLLAMSTGHHNEDIGSFNYFSDESPTKAFLAMPVAHKPGTHFVYNTPASYMLSAIVQQKAGAPILEYLKPRLFDPLGIENPAWDTTKHGVNLGGFGLSIRTEDIARFGQLYLQKGQWQGKQLLPAEWVEAATTRQASNGSNPKSDWDQGYGYQFWRCRNGAYRGDGAFGQFCVVMPERDAVLAITSGVKDMQAILNVTWENLLPAFAAKPLPADKASAEKLNAKLAGLQLAPAPKGEAPSGLSDLLGLHSGRQFSFPTNAAKLEWLSVDLVKGAVAKLSARVDGADYTLTGSQAGAPWGKGTFAFAEMKGQPAALSSGWDGDVLVAKIAFTEAPQVLTLRLKILKDRLLVDPEFFVTFGPGKRPQMVGTPAK